MLRFGGFGRGRRVLGRGTEGVLGRGGEGVLGQGGRRAAGVAGERRLVIMWRAPPRRNVPLLGGLGVVVLIATVVMIVNVDLHIVAK